VDVSWPDLYTDLRDMRQKRWEKLAKSYEAEPTSFWWSWHWVQHHPIFWYFAPGRREPRLHERNLVWERGVDEGLEIRPAMVDPETRRIEKPNSRNTHLEIWVEVFPASFRDKSIRLHDVDCDTGGDTYEEAIVNVAHEIYEVHGHDRRVLAGKWGGA
jgi:hypothetical protein